MHFSVLILFSIIRLKVDLNTFHAGKTPPRILQTLNKLIH